MDCRKHAGPLPGAHRPRGPALRPDGQVLGSASPARVGRGGWRAVALARAAFLCPASCPVAARFRGGRAHFPATVARVHADGALDLAYDDGDAEARVDPALVRALAPGEARKRAAKRGRPPKGPAPRKKRAGGGDREADI